jgi:transposase
VSAAAPLRRALSDITNISSLPLPTPPRRTQSTPGERSQFSRLSPLERYAVAVLTLDGQKQKDVAVKVGCSPKAVRTWSQRIGEDEDAEDSQRSGRPKLLHPSTMDALIDAAIEAPKHSTPRELKHKFDLSCSAKTIRRVLDDAGLFGRIARIIPPQNARITELRLSFARGYANMNWKLVLWSDEMSIRIGPQGQTWVQRPIGEAFDPQYCVEKEKHAPKVHVWGCMSAAGVGAVHVFTENLDAVLMKKILK